MAQFAIFNFQNSQFMSRNLYCRAFRFPNFTEIKQCAAELWPETIFNIKGHPPF